MRLTVDGREVHVATGGRAHVNGRPWMLFLHGAGSSHLAWPLQTRAFAYDGWNVLAPDLPGHFLSPGETISGVEAQAAFVLKLLDASGADKAVVVGHSMGALIGLEMAHVTPERVAALVCVGTAAAIPVNPSLIDTARNAEAKAFALMTSWSFGPDALNHDNTWPGASHVFYGLDVFRLNAAGALATDLGSCAAYAGGAAAAKAVSCPSLCILAELDRMTPLRGGRALASALPGSETVVVAGSGHTLPTEKPREVNAAIRDFLERRLASPKAA